MLLGYVDDLVVGCVLYRVLRRFLFATASPLSETLTADLQASASSPKFQPYLVDYLPRLAEYPFLE